MRRYPRLRTLDGMDLELRVDRMAAGGDAIGREESGRVVFVRGALPGELVRVRIASSAKDYAKADLVEVVEAAASRVDPSCRYVAAGCGGCGWQHVAADAQLDLKVAIVRDAMARQGRLPEASVVAGASASPLGYRTTLRMAVLPDGTVGYRAAGSNRIVPIGVCEVAHPALSALVSTIRVSGAEEVLLRMGVATGERLVWPIGDPDGRAAQVTGLPASVAVGEQAMIREDVAGHRFQVSATSFFQPSPEAAALLVSAVRAAAADTAADRPVKRFVDLYSGVGLFAATVATDAEVVCVERSASACRDARRNLRDRAVGIIEGDVGSIATGDADLVVADPARSGLDRTGVAAVVATQAPLLVLVSCDAASLGRDTRLLSEAGYIHAGSTVLDLFPQTPHVEVVTRFEHAGHRAP